MATHDLVPDEVLEDAEEDEMIKERKVQAPRTMNVSPEAAEDIRWINATPQPPTEKMRKLLANYQEYAKNNPGW